MSTSVNHLPECRYVVFEQQGQIPEVVIPMGCICDRLRACEQRVRDTALREAIAAVAATYDEVLGFPPRSVVLAAIQRLIDGPDMTPSDGGER